MNGLPPAKKFGLLWPVVALVLALLPFSVAFAQPAPAAPPAADAPAAPAEEPPATPPASPAPPATAPEDAPLPPPVPQIPQSEAERAKGLPILSIEVAGNRRVT